MGKRRPIIVGKLIFDTVGSATEHVKGLVARYADGDMARGPDVEFLKDLLELHPRCLAKVGNGVAGFTFSRNPEYTNTRTISVIRNDGSETDFSWRKCLNGETSEQLIRAALRSAVADQIIVFKRNAFLQQPVVCPETGETLTWEYCHVDHQAPNTFDQLVDEWLRSEKINLESVEISPSRDNSFTRALTNEMQRQSWLRFHEQRKQLRLLSPCANLSIAKRKSRE